MKTRTKFVIGGAIIFAVLTALSVQGLQEMTVFFYTPQEVLASPGKFENKTIRIGALVQKAVLNGMHKLFSCLSTSLKMVKNSFPFIMPESNRICSVKVKELLLRVKCKDHALKHINCWSSIVRNTLLKLKTRKTKKTTTNRFRHNKARENTTWFRTQEFLSSFF